MSIVARPLSVLRDKAQVMSASVCVALHEYEYVEQYLKKAQGNVTRSLLKGGLLGLGPY